MPSGPNNPVESKQQQLDAKTWEEFNLCLANLQQRVKVLPIMPVEQWFLSAALRYVVEISENIEGQ